MKATDITKQATGTKWAVVSRTAWVRKENKASGKVARNQCDQVIIVGSGMYKRTHYISTINDPDAFKVAPTAERSKGFLTYDGAVYRVVPSSDFIGLWSEKELVWSVQEQEEANRVKQNQSKALIREEAEATLKNSIPDIEENLRLAVTKLLVNPKGFEVRAMVNGDWNEDSTQYSAYLAGNVTMTISDFQRLLEKIYEAQDALA